MLIIIIFAKSKFVNSLQVCALIISKLNYYFKMKKSYFTK